MRKLLSILLLAVFTFSLVSPLVAFERDAGASVPICCRNNGKHHCMMRMGSRKSALTPRTQLRSPADRCPFCPRALFASHADVLSLAPSANVFAPPLSHPAGIPQTESRWRIARDRSRQKRGPPSFLG